MASFDPLVVVGMHVSFLVTSILGNLFIIIVHFQNWLKTHDFNPSILIINSIAFINIFVQGAIVFNEVTSLLFLDFYIQEWVLIPLVFIMSSLSFSSLWCSTVLCFYYCIKIVNFSGSFFYKLKSKIPVFVPWLLIISIAASWSVGIPTFLDLHIVINPLTDPTTENVTLRFSATLKSRCDCLFHMYMLFAAVAFAIIFANVTAIVTSLCKHMIRMRKNSEGSGNSRLQSHLSAAKTVISLLLLYLIFYVSLSSIFNAVENTGSFIYIFSFIMVSGFPTFNSIILIMGNRKLSNSLKKLLGMGPHSATIEVTVTTY